MRFRDPSSFIQARPGCQGGRLAYAVWNAVFWIKPIAARSYSYTIVPDIFQGFVEKSMFVKMSLMSLVFLHLLLYLIHAGRVSCLCGHPAIS